jgi:hypothetical protein
MELSAIEQELISTVTKRLQCYETLLSLTLEQKSILVDGRHAELSENLKRFDPIMMELNHLDQTQKALMKHLKELVARGTIAEMPNVKALCEDCNNRTIETASRLRELTKLNTRLLNTAMRYVDFTLGVICKSRPNFVDKKHLSLMLDRKV